MVLLLLLAVFEVCYYWILCFILWANSISYSIESSIHFYVWTSYLPVMLHLCLLFSLCAYYNKHFHQKWLLRFLRFIEMKICRICCANVSENNDESKAKIPQFLQNFSLFLFVFFMVTMVGIIAAHTHSALITSIVFICFFGIFGLVVSSMQAVVSSFDLWNISKYEQRVERVLVVFQLLASIFFVIIFCFNVCYFCDESWMHMQKCRKYVYDEIFS